MKTPPKNYIVPRPLPCVSCGQLVVGGQRNDEGAPEHFECQKKTTAANRTAAERGNTNE